MKKVLLASLALLLLALFALPAMATISAGSLVTQTADGQHYDIDNLFYANGDPLQLFEPPRNQVPPTIPPTDELWAQNNTSPITGPGYPSYVPSPGSSLGERFDIEGLFWRYNPASYELRVWVVSSIPPASLGGVHYSPDGGTTNYYFYMGDIFINTDGDSSTGAQGYDYALISFGNSAPSGWSGTGRDAGDLVALSGDETLSGINGALSYVGHWAIEQQTNPWAVQNPDTVAYDGNLVYQQLTGTTVAGGTTIEWLDDSRWGGATGPTFVSFFDVFVVLDSTYLMNPLAWHVTVQCGNDLGGGSGAPGGGGNVPVPGALILGIIGAGLVGLRRRMKA